MSEMQTDLWRPLLQTKPRATSTLCPGLYMLVSFSEKVFNACPDVFDEPLHVGIVTHAPHVDHVGAKVTRGGPLCVSETPGIHHMRELARSQLSESLSALCSSLAPSTSRTGNNRRIASFGGTSRRQSRRFLQPIDIVQNFSSSSESSILAQWSRDCAMLCPGQVIHLH